MSICTARPLLGCHLGVRSQAEKHFGFLGERGGGEFSIGVLSKVVSDERIDSRTVLAGVDFNTLILALEKLNGRQSFGLESVDSQLQALNIVVAPARVTGTAQDTLLENSVGARKV